MNSLRRPLLARHLSAIAVRGVETASGWIRRHQEQEMKTIFFVALVYLGLGADVVLPRHLFIKTKRFRLFWAGLLVARRTCGPERSLRSCVNTSPETPLSLSNIWQPVEDGRPPTTFFGEPDRTALRSGAWELPW